MEIGRCASYNSKLDGQVILKVGLFSSLNEFSQVFVCLRFFSVVLICEVE
jgi:hypothetical protein